MTGSMSRRVRWTMPRVRAGAVLSRPFDAIVIGAGIGGLVCASLLAERTSMRVLVLERHYEPGGLTQMFRRRRYAWDVGVHYLGELAPGTVLRRVFDVATGGRLRWARLPIEHDRLIAPGFDARFGGDRHAWRAQLLAHAPGEEAAIDRVLGEVEACARAAPMHLLGRMRAGAPESENDKSPFLRFSDRTAAAVIEAAGASPRLRTLLTYTWTDWGLPPEESSFAALALTMHHYFGGAYYPIGGGSEIADTLTRALVERGGAVVVRAGVSEIRVEGGRARGVRLEDGRELAAGLVISDAGASTTFERLVREPTELRDRARALGASGAHVALYLGLAAPPRALGLTGTNLWIRRDALERGHALDAGAWALGERELPPEIFVSTACATDPAYAERCGPRARGPDRSAITVATSVPFAAFERWAETTRGRRDGAYVETKDRLSRSMLRMLEPHLDLGALEHVEMSTPLSTREFTGHARGETYGLAPTPRRFRHGPRPHTPIEGLYLTGQDVWMGGVGGAACGGLLTACAVTRRDLARELLFG